VEKSSGACNNALLWLDTQLLRQQLPPSHSFFRSVKLVENASQAVLPVFFRQADACLLPRWSYDTMVELNPQVKEQTTILVHSPLLARGGLFMVKGLPPSKQEMIPTTLKVWQTNRARQFWIGTLNSSKNLIGLNSWPARSGRSWMGLPAIQNPSIGGNYEGFSSLSSVTAPLNSLIRPAPLPKAFTD
jgi:hypothetical protein